MALLGAKRGGLGLVWPELTATVDDRNQGLGVQASLVSELTPSPQKLILARFSLFLFFSFLCKHS